MNHIQAAIIAAVLLNGTAYAQTPLPADSLTLPQAISLVLRRNPTLSQGAQAIEAARSAVEVSRSGYYPTASTELSYTRVEPVAEVDLGGAPLALNPADNYDAHIVIRQTLYDFHRTAASVDLAGSRLDLEHDRLEEVRRDLAFETVRSFYSALLLRESVRVQEELLGALTEYLAVTERKLASGSATEFDVLTTRVRLSAAGTQKIDLENSLRQEEISFRRLADLPPEYRPLFRGTFEADSLVTDPGALMEEATARRPDLRSAIDAVASANRRLELAATTSSPSISLVLAGGVKNGYMPDLNEIRGNFAAGVSVEVPVFDGYRTRNMEEGARVDVLAATEHQRAVESRVRSEIQQALSNLNASAEKLQTTKLNVVQAQRAAELARVKYDSGVITNLDLLDAETSLEQAKLTDVQALFGYVMSAFELKRASGEQIW
jgi:outer membrane protein